MEDVNVIPLLSPADHQAAGADLDSINMGLVHKVRVVLQFGAITGDATLVQLYAGATAGAKTTELPFTYRLSSVDTGSASADVFGTATNVASGGSGLSLLATSYDNRVLTIDVKSDDLPNGKQWLTVQVDDGSASVLLMGAIAIGWPRYEATTQPTVL